MATKFSIEEVFDLDEPYVPSYEVIAEKAALDYQLNILNILREEGIKQNDVARKMEITPPTLSSMLNRSTNLTLKTMARIAHSLGYAIESPKLVPLRWVSKKILVNPSAENTVFANIALKDEYNDRHELAFPNQLRNHSTGVSGSIQNKNSNEPNKNRRRLAA